MTIRSQHQQYIVKKAAGGSPDPATYCPANGYIDPTDPVQVEDAGLIPNPILPADGWNLLATFQNNSPYTTTFDPIVLSTSGQFAWDLGDGTILIGDKSVSHTYLTTATRTVKLYRNGTCVVTNVDFRLDNIVADLDLSDNSFMSLTRIDLNDNLLMTSVTFPATANGIISFINLSATGIAGVLDLSMFEDFLVVGANLSFVSLPSLTGITFASAITGKIVGIAIRSTGIVGILDLSMFTVFSSSSDLTLYQNPALTGVTFANPVTGTINSIQLQQTGIIGVLDLSMFTSFGSSSSIFLYSNPSTTSVLFASTITGTIGNLLIYSTGVTGTLDLSKITTYTATATVDLHANTSMTSVTFKPTTITGIIKTLRLDGNTSLGYVDVTKLNTGIASLSWRFDGNGWSAAIVNQVLVDINSISASGFAGRVINIGGSNTDPDTTSGGVDGVAARTALQGKGFTVTIT